MQPSKIEAVIDDSLFRGGPDVFLRVLAPMAHTLVGGTTEPTTKWLLVTLGVRELTPEEAQHLRDARAVRPGDQVLDLG